MKILLIRHVKIAQKKIVMIVFLLTNVLNVVKMHYILHIMEMDLFIMLFVNHAPKDIMKITWSVTNVPLLASVPLVTVDYLKDVVNLAHKIMEKNI